LQIGIKPDWMPHRVAELFQHATPSAAQIKDAYIRAESLPNQALVNFGGWTPPRSLCAILSAVSILTIKRKGH
jgi:hypothetical protein